MRRPVEILAVASFGGHFEQLLQLRAAWHGRACVFVTTRRDPDLAVDGEPPAIVMDCHGHQWARAAVTAGQLLVLFARHRPRLLVTTGALPGLIAGIVARLFAARVIWIDSVANAECLSTSGRHARRIADHHLSQWPDVALREDSTYAGSLF